VKSIIIVFLIIVGLWLDQSIKVWGQTLVNLFIWSFFLGLLKTSSRDERWSLVVCLGYATGGELFLSLIWGLYEYRLHNLPLFVPPGHALLFTLGLTLAPRLPGWIIWLVPSLMAPYALFAFIAGFDTTGGFLFLIFLLCLIFGTAKKLYATMFILSLSLEIYGTWLGNWTWVLQEPWFGLTSTNPPASAGAFYCMLDLLVVATVSQRRVGRAQRNPTRNPPTISD
jgi:hypothetical protein